MKAYLISINGDVGWDEYYAAVVIAKDETEAVAILKSEHPKSPHEYQDYDVSVERIRLNNSAVVLEAFNAG